MTCKNYGSAGAYVDDFRFRRDRARDGIRQLRQIRRRHRELDLGDGDLVAAHALLPRVQHAAVVLVGCDDVIARLQIDAELDNLRLLESMGLEVCLLRAPADCAS